MRYADVRGEIYTGDLIALRGPRGVRAALTRWLLLGPYTRVGIAVWVGAAAQRRLMVAEQTDGGRLVPLSRYAAEGFDVYDAPRYATLLVEDALYQMIGRHRGYGWKDLARIALHRLVGVRIAEYDDMACEPHCPSMAAAIWLRAGWVPVAFPAIPAPNDVAWAQAVPARFEVRTPAPWDDTILQWESGLD